MYFLSECAAVAGIRRRLVALGYGEPAVGASVCDSSRDASAQALMLLWLRSHHIRNCTQHTTMCCIRQRNGALSPTQSPTIDSTSLRKARQLNFLRTG